MRHEADHREDDEAGEHAGAGVDTTHYQSVPVHNIVSTTSGVNK